MTRYLIYFYYFHLEEPLKIALDFDSAQKASDLLKDLTEELQYHIGEEAEEEPDFSAYRLVEHYGLRPFGGWEQPLSTFVSRYGNEFTVIDLNRPALGRIEHIRPLVIAGVRPQNLAKIGPKSPLWGQRTKLELRLVTSLVRWMQFTQKRNWLQIVPNLSTYNQRVWQITTTIPDTESFAVTWIAVLSEDYPTLPPNLYIKTRDHFVVRDVEKIQRWRNEHNEEFYHIRHPPALLETWSDEQYFVDWLLSGFWNYLVRELEHTFTTIKNYQTKVGIKNYLSLFPGDLEDYTDPKIIVGLEELGIFLTRVLSRIPEKANEVLKGFFEKMPTHRTYDFIKWEECAPSLTAETSQLFSHYICQRIEVLVANHQPILEDELLCLRNLMAKWTDTNALERKKELEGKLSDFSTLLISYDSESKSP